MSPRSIRRYDGSEPAAVGHAVARAAAVGFDNACLPEVGRLLALLAATARQGVIGEAGTGCGVGLAWMAQAAPPTARLVSVERDGEFAARARDAFAADGRVSVIHGDAQQLLDYGPFDLLFWDGGEGSGKRGEAPIDPTTALTATGVLVIDDFADPAGWPPHDVDGQPDLALCHWLSHPDLLSTVIPVADGDPPFAVMLARRRPPAGRGYAPASTSTTSSKPSDRPSKTAK